MPDETGLEGVEIIDARGRYVLGSTEHAYGVWDRLVPDAAVAVFAGTDDGLDRAEMLFGSLVQEERRKRDPWPRWARWTTLLGLAVWVTSGIFTNVIIGVTNYNFPSEGPSIVLRVFQVVQACASLIWTAGAVTVVVLWLARNPRLRIEPEPE